MHEEENDGKINNRLVDGKKKSKNKQKKKSTRCNGVKNIILEPNLDLVLIKKKHGSESRIRDGFC